MSIPVPVLSGSLPASASAPFPAVINLAPPPPPEPNDKKFIIVHTVDIPDADLNTFKRYSQNVVKYDYNVEGSVVIDNLIFDYLFLDLRDAQARKYFDNNNLTNYNIIIYCSFIEKFDAYIEHLGGNNILSEFPQPFHYKSQFDSALLTVPTDAPNSTCLSCINYGSSFLDSLKKK